MWKELSKDDEGHEILERQVRLTFKKNPVPGPLRRFLKDPAFAVTVRAKWWNEAKESDADVDMRVEELLFQARVESCEEREV